MKDRFISLIFPRQTSQSFFDLPIHFCYSSKIGFLVLQLLYGSLHIQADYLLEDTKSYSVS